MSVTPNFNICIQTQGSTPMNAEARATQCSHEAFRPRGLLSAARASRATRGSREKPAPLTDQAQSYLIPTHPGSQMACTKTAGPLRDSAAHSHAATQALEVCIRPRQTWLPPQPTTAHLHNLAERKDGFLRYPATSGSEISREQLNATRKGRHFDNREGWGCGRCLNAQKRRRRGWDKIRLQVRISLT